MMRGRPFWTKVPSVGEHGKIGDHHVGVVIVVAARLLFFLGYYRTPRWWGWR